MDPALVERYKFVAKLFLKKGKRKFSGLSRPIELKLEIS